MTEPCVLLPWHSTPSMLWAHVRSQQNTGENTRLTRHAQYVSSLIRQLANRLDPPDTYCLCMWMNTCTVRQTFSWSDKIKWNDHTVRLSTHLLWALYVCSEPMSHLELMENDNRELTRALPVTRDPRNSFCTTGRVQHSVWLSRFVGPVKCLWTWWPIVYQRWTPVHWSRGARFKCCWADYCVFKSEKNQLLTLCSLALWYCFCFHQRQRKDLALAVFSCHHENHKTRCSGWMITQRLKSLGLYPAQVLASSAPAQEFS